MSGDALLILEDNNLLLESIEEQIIESNILLENINNGLSVTATILIVIILIVLLHYSYKLIDMFFS